MRADGDVDLSRDNVRHTCLRLFRRPEAAQHFDAHREWLEAVLEGLEMLECQNGGRREHRNLLAVSERLERRSHDDLGLAESDVAAQKPVHGLRALHITLDLFDGRKLIPSLGEFKSVFKLALPIAVTGKCKALRYRARGVELQ